MATYKICFNKPEFNRTFAKLRPVLVRKGFLQFYASGDLIVAEYSSEEDQKQALVRCRPLVKFLGVYTEK